MNAVSLNMLLPGERGTIEGIESTRSNVRQRLMEMGLIKGTLVEMIRFAPMGDPIEVQVGSYRLSLRRGEAESILVHKELN
jgi:ferrous iron transport protein A